jgi:beta-glucosidase
MRRRNLFASALVLLAVCGIAAALGASTPARASAACPWMDTSKTPDQRAQLLLAAMTIDDKIAMVHGDGQIFTEYGAAGHVPGNAALCIPDLYLNDAGQGVGDGQTDTTAFPAPIAQASSWDPSLDRRLGDAIGWESWHKGIDVMLAPDVNLARVPMNGRNFEAFGEDPYLSGQVGAAVIQGIQGEHVIATVKHYAENSQETNRNTISEDVDERTLHELELQPFETAVKQGQVGSVMCAYNEVNSIYSCEQPTLLTSILKSEFGFTGFVMSDWGATHSTAPAANAGLDMEMYQSTYFGSALKAAVQDGQVPEARLDDMVLRILRTMFRIGVFDDPPAAEPNAYAADVERPEDVTLARQVSEDGTVLLKDAGGVLPLTGQGKKIAVIGQPAGPAVQNYYNGAGSSHIPEAGGKQDVVSPLQGITQRALGNGDTVVYADGSSAVDAVAAATASDVAVVFVGQEDSEGTDRANLTDSDTICTLAGCETLPVDQDKLIESVAAANPNTIVVLDTGGPVLMPWVDQVKGILEAWYPGQEDGNAIAALLFGDVNPSGKLPETFPKAQGDLPTQTAQQYPGVNGHAVYSEGLDVGYRWYDAKNIAPLFPFGYGLSYTTFGYSGLSVKANGGADTAVVSFALRNTGSRAGAEVAQLYVGDPSAAGEPPQQLKAFQKVFLPPGQSQTVTLSLDLRAFAIWDATKHGWVVPGGTYRILVGSSSRNIRLQGTANVAKKVLGP